jgi:hypothetical protein
MTANEKAYGGVASDIFKDSTNSAYLKNVRDYTFLEKDSIYKARAIVWIKENPIKFVTLYVKKFAGLYMEDSWSDRFNVAGECGFVSGYVIAGKVSKADFIAKMAGRVLKSSFFYFVLLAFLYSLFVYRKTWWSEKGIFLFLIVVSTLGTCVFSVGPRYHYPMMFAIVLIAAYGAEYFIETHTSCDTC